MKANSISSLFLDSGAFSLPMLASKYAKENERDAKDYYESDEFWQLMQDYATFVKENEEYLDYYASMDVIGDCELSLRNWLWLCNEGLNPIPTVHFGSDPVTILTYKDKGAEIIALGGLATKRSTAKRLRYQWIQSCFEIVCDNPQRIPITKIHGFGITAVETLLRFPWYSVDSTSWTKAAAWGSVYVPRSVKGKFAFDQNPFTLAVSVKCPSTDYLSGAMKRHCTKWFERAGVTVEGVREDYKERSKNNALYFYLLERSLPPYPQPLQLTNNGFMREPL